MTDEAGSEAVSALLSVFSYALGNMDAMKAYIQEDASEKE